MSEKLEGGFVYTTEYLMYRLKKMTVEVGDCWEWKGYLTVGSTPTWRYMVDGKWSSVPVRRSILMVRGVNIAPHERAVTTCGNKFCVNPEHVVKRTVSKVMHERNQTITRGAKGLLRAAKIAAWRREQFSTLTPEQVEKIRAHEGAAREVADQYGISTKAFNAIRRGETWKDYTNPWRGLMA